jgi:hypothetical protein
MNWVYYNLVRHVRPDIFGYIDHDCFPIAPIDIPARMAGKSVYGSTGKGVYGSMGKAVCGRKSSKQRPDGAWTLWAGLCFFRLSAVEDIELDFKHRYEFGLDTGGGNWPTLYGRLRPGDTVAAEVAQLHFQLGDLNAQQNIYDGRLLHLGGASYRSKFGKTDYRQLLSDHIWDTYLGGRTARILPL